MICATNDQHGIRVLARWHKEHHARRGWAPAGPLADVAQGNLRDLGRPATPDAVQAEVERLEMANRTAIARAWMGWR